MNRARMLAVVLGLLVLAFSITGSAQQIELTVQTYWDPEIGTGTALMELFDRFEEENPHISVTHIYVPFAELLRTILTQSLTGTLPDIIFADNPDILQLAASGALKDITRHVEEWGQWDDFFVGPQLATTLDERIYAVQLVTNNLALFYNEEVFADLSISETPSTWDDLKAVSRRIVDNIPGMYGLGFTGRDAEDGTWQFLPFLWSNGGSLLELDQPEAVGALELWTDLVKEGLSPADVIGTWGQGDVTINFNNRRFAMMVMGPWELGGNLLDTPFEFGIAQLPVPVSGAPTVVPMGGEAFGLSSMIDPAKEQAAWQLIAYLAEPENQAFINLRSGTIPTRAATVPLVLERDPRLEMFIRQAETALPRPVMGGLEKYPQVSAITRTNFQRAIAGSTTPEQAFRDAAREVIDVFDTPEEYREARDRARAALQSVLLAQ